MSLPSGEQQSSSFCVCYSISLHVREVEQEEAYAPSPSSSYCLLGLFSSAKNSGSISSAHFRNPFGDKPS
jgi:hypothetical protein